MLSILRSITMFKAEKKGKQLILTLDLHEPKPSSTGKSFLVAGTGGNQVTEVEVDGYKVVVGCTCYIKK